MSTDPVDFFGELNDGIKQLKLTSVEFTRIWEYFDRDGEL